MNQAKLIELYKAILATCWMTTDADGNIYNRIATGSEEETRTYVVIDQKRLVLPTEQQLLHADPDNKIVFHPLCESAMKGESLVVTKLRKMVAVRINWTISHIFTVLVRLGASRAEHEKLSPNQSHILSAMKDMDETSVRDFEKMVSNSTTKNQLGNTFYKLFLKRGARINDTSYARGGVVSFPFYEELKKTQDKYFDVKLRKMDRLALIALFESVIPGIEKPDAYSRGVDTTIAPFMDALMRTVAAIGGTINNQVELYRNVIPEPDLCILDSSWEDAFKHLNHYKSAIDSIPPQSGNEGLDKQQDVLARETSINPNQAPAYVPPAQQQPQYRPSSQPVHAYPQHQQQATRPVQADSNDYAARLRAFQERQQQPQAQPQPQYYQPAPQQRDPWGNPVPQQPPPGYYPPQNRPYGGGYGNGGGGRL